MSSSTGAIVRPSAELAVIDLAGNEIAMGRQHGELTRELGGWEDNLAFYADMPRHILGGGRRDRGRRMLVRALTPLLAAGLERLERARPAWSRARTEAFLKALGRAPAERKNVFVLDLAQNAIGVLGRWGLVHQAAALAPPGACSSFALWGEASEDGRLLHARNFDLLGIGVWDRAPTVVFCAPTRGLRYGFVSTRGADVPGVTAFNEAGLTLSAHTRFHREVAFDGLGVVDLGHLIASRATSLADAVAIASEHRIASSWGFVVSSARERRAIVIEAHAGRIAVHRPRPGATHLAAANRNRVPVMQRGELAPSEAWVRYSDGREAVLERRLAGARGLGVGDAAALLASHEAGDVPGWERLTGDCPAQTITIQSAVVDAEREEIWVSSGGAPASKGPWVRVPWRWGRAAGCRVVGASAVESEVAAGIGAREAAYAHLVEAARREQDHADEAAVEEALLRGLAMLPADPSLRQLAGGLALRAGRFDDAVEHFEAALASERSVFRIAELHRWAARAAHWSARWRHREIAVSFQLLTIG